MLLPTIFTQNFQFSSITNKDTYQESEGLSLANDSDLIKDKASGTKFLEVFIGMMDGDGYFDIGPQKQYNKKTKDSVRPTIRIRLGINKNHGIA